MPENSIEPFPDGLEFSTQALNAEQACDLETRKKMPEHDRKLLQEVGTVLSFLYRFATCYWG
jgi:hypothetical protein